MSTLVRITLEWACEFCSFGICFRTCSAVSFVAALMARARRTSSVYSLGFSLPR